MLILLKAPFDSARSVEHAFSKDRGIVLDGAQEKLGLTF
jgi:hypothetical protein